ncbi:MAG: ComF family protein [Oscillospiraceae bacterium]|nr:ComF family protein [Oscillospiraceae bacterium]
MGIFSGLLDVLFPPKCVFCGKCLKKGETSVCSACVSETELLRGSEARQQGEYFDVCVSPLKYDGNVRKSILRYKFKGATNYADYYGALLADCIREQLAGQYDLISWVPLSVDRKKSRGYDQAMLLACAAALTLEDVAVDTLEKRKNVTAQSTMGDREQRKANISGAYSVPDPELIAGKRILLIDDIITTGATLSECARTLLLAGADSVVCAALARA